MYIRRKVFSIGQDENGQEKLFSTTQRNTVAEEKEFSQKKEIRTFSERKENLSQHLFSKKDKAEGAAAGVGAVGLGAGAVVGADKLGKAIDKKIAKDVKKVGYKSLDNQKLEKLGKKLQKPAEWIAKKVTRKG